MTTARPVQLVWFKRDLRIVDHRALTCAAARGPVVPLYVVEPELWAQPEASGRHWDFLRESLTELRGDLAAAGQPLIIRVGEIRSVLAALKAETDFATLWSHEETGNRWSYERDLAVAEWCRSNRIDWREERQFGVIRRLKARDGWARRWDQFMTEPVEPAPTLTPVKAALPLGRLPARDSLGLASDACPERQRGGREAGLDRLYSFLEHRGTDYRSAMASPLAGAEACSRISPYLAFGCLSLREVTQHTWNRQRELKHQATALDRDTDAAQTVGRFRASLKSFNGRLHWHCHFMQKLEDEPALETRNLHRAYDGMRPTSPDTTRLAAWERGETGLPFVDACMRSLAATGWLNFRMRAMLMATASYHLWLDWRKPGEHLARLFTDYEPGIHWPQVQMQSGTTGINTVRIYNPVKQGYDQDPEGAFVRRWIPELAVIDGRWLQEPWKAPNADTVLGKRYPAPIVDHLAAARSAKERIYAVRRGTDYRDAANAIQTKHGSRRSGIRPTGSAGSRKAAKRTSTASKGRQESKEKKAAADAQIELPLNGGREDHR